MNQPSELLARIEDFIKKYYRTKWILGLLYLLCASISLFILFSGLEFFGYYTRVVRLGLLIIFWFITVWIFIQYFLSPFLAYNRIGKRMNNEIASKIIGDHFPAIKDKLLNAIQLSEMGALDLNSSDLIKASIDQRVRSFSSIPFYGAIDQTKNKAFLKTLLALMGLTLFILGVYPSLLLQGSHRIITFKNEYFAPPPFSFNIENPDLSAIKNGTFILRLNVKGRVLPDEVLLMENKSEYPLTKISTSQYSFQFNNLQRDIPFRFHASGFYSDPYLIKVHPAPNVLNFSTQIRFPNYLHKPDLIVQNSGDLTVPEGSDIFWKINTIESESLVFISEGISQQLKEPTGIYSLVKRAEKDFQYAFVPKNRYVKIPDTFHYTVTVIKDLPPEISLQISDSTPSQGKLVLRGNIKDDYGFSRLIFHYSYPATNSLGQTSVKIERYSLSVPISTSLTNQPFGMVIDPRFLVKAQGKDLSYYFEIWDNDGTNGPKSSKTTTQNLYLQSKKETFAKKEFLEKSAASNIKKALSQAKKLELDAKLVLEKVQTASSLTFEQKENIKDVLHEKSLLDSTLSQIARENDKASEIQDQDLAKNPYLEKKEEEMKSILDSLLSKESKNLLEKLSKLLNENKLHDTKQAMKNFNEQNRSLSEELKRAENLYKLLERDRQIQNQIDALHRLSIKEQDLAKNTVNDPKQTVTELKKLEITQAKDFEKIKKDLGSLEKANEEDKVNPGFENPKAEEDQISKNQEKTQEQLSQGNKKSASELQKKTVTGIDELGFALSKMKQTIDAEEVSLNLHSIRLILENLLRISYKQESLMDDLHNTSPNDPSIVNYIQQQFSLKEAIDHVQDSLNALSQKVPAIHSFVTKEMKIIHSNMEQLTGFLADRRFYEAGSKQQFVMTSINNLAVILSNIERQMAQALSTMKGAAPKPGNNFSLGSLIDRQKRLNQETGKMEPGEQGNSETISEVLVKMAAEQESIRQAIGKMRNKAESKGSFATQLGQIQKEMEESETEFLNHRIKPRNLFRQKEILTRMLEAEKAEKEQGMENKFQSSSGKEQGSEKIKALATFLPEKFSEIELLKTLPPNINTYFKMKINTYFNLLNDSQSRNEKLGAH